MAINALRPGGRCGSSACSAPRHPYLQRDPDPWRGKSQAKCPTPGGQQKAPSRCLVRAEGWGWCHDY